MKKIKVMAVDDSVLFRSQVQKAFEGCSSVEITTTAANGKIALEKLKTQDIELIILDLEMPEMDGIETIKEITQRGLKQKIILFSSVTTYGAEKTLQALRLGAHDFVPKPVADGSPVSPAEKIKESLFSKIISLCRPSKSVSEIIEPRLVSSQLESFVPDVVVIASSTGGPNALYDIFKRLTGPLSFPVLITQHMPPIFTTSLAARLGDLSGKICHEGRDGEIIQSNQIYLAPGDFHMSLVGNSNEARIKLDKGPLRNYVRPCADYLFESAAKIYGKNTLGIVLTGMGKDGLDGARAIKAQSGPVIIQDQASCVVFGMPGAIYENKLYDLMSSPEEIAFKIETLSKARRLNYAS